MKIQGSRRIDASPDLVWTKLNDTQVLKDSIAGCESLQATDEGRFLATVKAKVGPVAASFKGHLTLSNVVPARSYTLAFDGHGVAGFARGTADVNLEASDGGTEIRYVVTAQIGGKIAQVGQRLIDGVARKMADDFFARFEAVLQGRPVAAPAAAAAPEPG